MYIVGKQAQQKDAAIFRGADTTRRRRGAEVANAHQDTNKYFA